MTPHEMIRHYLANNLPFAQHAGVELLEVGAGTGVARLEESPTTLNHIGTQHAGAMFTLAETASGAAAAGLLPERIMSLRPVARGATITYTKIAKGTLTAEAGAGKTAEEVLGELDRTGRADFDVGVIIRDADGETVAEMAVTWNLRTG